MQGLRLVGHKRLRGRPRLVFLLWAPPGAGRSHWQRSPRPELGSLEGWASTSRVDTGPQAEQERPETEGRERCGGVCGTGAADTTLACTCGRWTCGASAACAPPDARSVELRCPLVSGCDVACSTRPEGLWRPGNVGQGPPTPPKPSKTDTHGTRAHAEVGGQPQL